MINQHWFANCLKSLPNGAVEFCHFCCWKENVEDMSQTEWKIIQQIGFEFQTRKLQ